MSHPYGTLTGLDYAGKKKKIMTPDHVYSNTKIQPRTKYERYFEKPEITIKSEEPKKIKEKTEEMTTPRPESAITPVKLFTAFLVLACLMIVWIWETNYVREGLVEIEKLKDEKMELEKTNEAIQVDITKLSDYQRIEKIASEKLNMTPSKEKPGVIFLDPEKAETLHDAQNASQEP